MRVLSLFDGVSVGRLALSRLGYHDVEYYASEINPDAMAVSADNWDGIIQLGDICNVRYIRHSKSIVCDNGTFEVGDIDLLLGGSPCQGFSAAGRRTNFDHSESKLLYEFERIRNEVRPRYMLLENVQMNSESQALVTEMVQATPLVKLHKLNSKEWCAQSRKRLYWTNIPYDGINTSTFPKTIADLVGDGYSGIRMRCHGFAGKGFKILPHVVKTATVVCTAFRTNTWVIQNGEKRQWTIEELEQLQTLPEGYTKVAKSITRRQACVGNCWTAAVIEDLLRGMRM
jgi:site-specific DNA-cytosine methylase